MRNLLKIALCGIAVFSLSKAEAALSPLALNILPPLQFPPDDFNVTGLRFSLLYGRQRAVNALDIGVLGNITTQNFTGLAVAGGFNYTQGQTTILGLQLAGVTNINIQKTNVIGFQVATIMNRNDAASSVVGVQLALVNLADHTDVYGFQLGLYNRALSVYGFQIGLVNVTQNLHGLQIGLLNFNHTGLFVVSPFLNIGF